MDLREDEIYPAWMQRWNAWTRRVDREMIAFFSDLGSQVGDAALDLRYRLDRLLFGPAKDDQVRTAMAHGKGDYEYWRNRLEDGASTATTSLPEDRW